LESPALLNGIELAWEAVPFKSDRLTLEREQQHRPLLMSQIIQIGEQSVTLHQFTGKVVNASKNMESIMQGSISAGGGTMYQGTGTTAPVNVRLSSTTVVHDQIFIQNKHGEELVFQLKGFNLAVREGNLVTAAWLIPKDKEQGPYIAFINHSTNDKYVASATIKQVVSNCRPIKWPLLWASLIGLILTIPIGVWAGDFWGFTCFFVSLFVFVGIGVRAIYHEFSVVPPTVKELHDRIQQITLPDPW